MPSSAAVYPRPSRENSTDLMREGVPSYLLAAGPVTLTVAVGGVMV